MPNRPLNTEERYHVERLRNVLKHFQMMWSHYESTGTYEFVDSERFTWNVFDLKRLIEGFDDHFPPRQAQALRLHLVEDISEEDCALLMGLRPTSPVAIYVTEALRRFASMTHARSGKRVSTNLDLGYRQLVAA